MRLVVIGTGWGDRRVVMDRKRINGSGCPVEPSKAEAKMILCGEMRPHIGHLNFFREKKGLNPVPVEMRMAHCVSEIMPDLRSLSIEKGWADYGR